MSISEHSNGLASDIECRCDKKKQDKRQSNHHFPLHLPQKTKHHSGETQYAALICYSSNFQWVFGMQLVWFDGDTNKFNVRTVLASRNTQRQEEQVILAKIRRQATESLPQAGNDQTTINHMVNGVLKQTRKKISPLFPDLI